MSPHSFLFLVTTHLAIALPPGESNPHHYFVASQDPELRRELGKLPGVPLLHIIRNTIVLEKPTLTSQDKAQQVGNVCFLFLFIGMCFCLLFLFFVLCSLFVVVVVFFFGGGGGGVFKGRPKSPG